jgi:aminoglycoside phosphotransferase family enzyme
MADDGELAQEPYRYMAEAHSSVVSFAGDRAYKLKKPVNLGFLDFIDGQAWADGCARDSAERILVSVRFGLMCSTRD